VSGVPRTLGTELVTNGRFAADTDWTKGTGWTIAAGTAVKLAGVASLLSQDVTLTAGKTYVLVYNITRTAGTITAQLTGGTTFNGASRNATGSYVEQFVANTNTTLSFSADASFAGTVYNVTLREVTSFVCPGLFFYGSPTELTNSATINMSARGDATIVASLKQDSATGSQNALIFGAYGSTSGSILADLATQPFLRLWGTAGAVINVPTAERGSGIASREYCNVYSVHMTGAAIADQVKIRTRGVTPTQTATGSLNGASALANSRFRIGASSLRGLVHCALLINRTLTADEIAAAEEWAMRGKVRAAVLGDSTVSITSSPTPNAQRVSDFVGGLVTGAADIAEAGSRIADQLAYWSAIADKSKLQLVVVQIGLNDVKGRVGANAATTATVIADLQSLINTINTDKPTGCKVYIAAMTPCKVWLDAATNAAAAYSAWLAVNEAIAGNGATPITGVDGRITSHVAALADGSNNLLGIYDHNGDGVHESNEARIIIAQAWRTALEAGGVL
jgi:lysophospholipase L1-like esterase